MKTCRFCGTTVENTKRKCPACGSSELLQVCQNCSTQYGGNYCPTCGVKKGQREKICPDCQNVYFTNACPNCGYSSVRKKIAIQNSRDHTAQEPIRSTRPIITKPMPAKVVSTRKNHKNKKRHPVRWFIIIIIILAAFGNKSSNTKSTERRNTVTPTPVINSASTKKSTKTTNTPRVEIAMKSAPLSSSPFPKATESPTPAPTPERKEMIFIPAGENTQTKDQSSQEVIINTEHSDVTFESDTIINRYINQYNKVNTGKQITASLLKKHMSNDKHDYEAELSLEGFNLLLTDGTPMIIDVTNNTNKHNEDYKSLFFELAKGFSPSLTEEMLTKGWDDISNNSEHIIEFENFACALEYDKDKIVRMVFEGEP